MSTSDDCAMDGVRGLLYAKTLSQLKTYCKLNKVKGYTQCGTKPELVEHILQTVGSLASNDEENI